MTRLDWLVLRRILGRVLLTVMVFFAILALVESLDAWRFTYLSENGGPQRAILAIVASAAKWSVKILVVTVLLGTILALLDLHSRRELTVIKATGQSIWRVLRTPLLAILAIGLFITFVGERASTEFRRSIFPAPVGENGVLTASGELWLQQTDGERNYILRAGSIARRGTSLNDVTVFFEDAKEGERILARSAKLTNGKWQLTRARQLRADQPVVSLGGYALKTLTTPADLQMKLGATEDFTLGELGDVLAAGVSDPAVKAAAAMRYYRILSMPLLLAGGLLIAFAFTAGYRRANKHGTLVLYGVLLGLVVFVLTEMADRAGAAGALDPLVAAIGPALVAMLIGVTVLLYREDGRA